MYSFNEQKISVICAENSGNDPMWWLLPSVIHLLTRQRDWPHNNLAHPEGSVPDREAGWKEGVEQDIYLRLLCHSTAVTSSSADAQRCQALRRQHLKHNMNTLSSQG